MIFSYTGVPDSHKRCTFDSFKWTEGKKGLRTALEEFAGGSGKGMVLIGKPGIGKTHLMVATYLYAQDKYMKFPGSDIIFFDWQQFLNYVRDGFKSSIRGDALTDKICSTELLIMDDVRPEPQGTFWKEIFEQIIEYGYNNNTKLLLSTNADSTEELCERWGMTDYHFSRLVSMCKIVVVKGKDARLEGNKE